MDKKKVAESLQDNEILVLKNLKPKATVSELAKQTKLPEVAIGRAAMWLENKKLITSRKSTTTFATLDTLGKKYSKSSLPELQILKDLPKTIPELNKAVSKLEFKTKGSP